MKTLSILLLATLALSACGNFKPDDNLNTVLKGNLFNGPPPNPAEEKKLEQTARENARVMPPKEEQRGVGLKMAF